MGKKTSSKRKSLANAEETPNKIRKTNASASKNKSNKSTIKNNGTKITPKREKLTKQIEEDESDESDNSMDELNGTNDNLHDAINSDNEIEEGDTDEKEDIDKDDSDDANSDTDEKEDIDKDDSDDANSDTDEKEDIDKDDSDDANSDTDEDDKDDSDDANSDTDDKDDSDDANSSDKAQSNETVSDKGKIFSVSVIGLDLNARVQNIFKDCNILNVQLLKNQVTKNPSGRAIVFFEDKKSLEKALEKHQTEYNGRVITVRRSDLCVYVKGMKPYTNIRDIFNDCNIDIFKICKDKLTNKQTGRAYVTFKDEESVTKALKKDGTRFNEYVLTVEPAVKDDKKTEFKVFVKNLNCDKKLEDLFKDCKINLVEILRDSITNSPNGMAFVYFEDEESLQKALLKQATKHDGRVITVLRDGYSVFVKNLNVESKLKDVFKDCNIQWINKIMDKRENKYTGCAIVNFKDDESLKKALSKNGTEFDGNIMYVRSASNPKNSANSADLKNKRENNYKGYATGNYKDKEYLKKSKTEFNGKTRNAEFGYNKYKQRHSENSDYFKSTESSCNPESKIEFLKKQILLEELKLKTQKLEQEIYEQQKSLNT